MNKVLLVVDGVHFIRLCCNCVALDTKESFYVGQKFLLKVHALIKSCIKYLALPFTLIQRAV